MENVAGKDEKALKVVLKVDSTDPSRKHAYITLTPLYHFYIVKLGFTGVYIIFLISA